MKKSLWWVFYNNNTYDTQAIELADIEMMKTFFNAIHLDIIAIEDYWIRGKKIEIKDFYDRYIKESV